MRPNLPSVPPTQNPRADLVQKPADSDGDPKLPKGISLRNAQKVAGGSFGMGRLGGNKERVRKERERVRG